MRAAGMRALLAFSLAYAGKDSLRPQWPEWINGEIDPDFMSAGENATSSSADADLAVDQQRASGCTKFENYNVGSCATCHR